MELCEFDNLQSHTRARQGLVHSDAHQASLATDVLILVMPSWMLHDLSMPLGRKLMVIAFLSFGIAITVVGAVRTSVLVKIPSSSKLLKTQHTACLTLYQTSSLLSPSWGLADQPSNISLVFVYHRSEQSMSREIDFTSIQIPEAHKEKGRSGHMLLIFRVRLH